MAPRKNRRDTTTVPKLRTPPALPSPAGPKLYRTPRDKGFKGGPSLAPPGFVRGQTSQTEWWVYWGMYKALAIPDDPRKGPPFEGYPNVFGYQVGTNQRGGSVADFIVYPNRRSYGQRVIFRVQTEHFHNFVDSERQAYDLLQMWRLSEYDRVVDIYDWEFMEDPTGQAIVVLLKRGMAGETWSPPGSTGIAQRVRPGRRMP